ncbi:MAG: hypothetical protein M3305_07760 [Actinomycetota bacterium]|nr:hypothetical protein [Actinomycetota bacterium]
MVPSVLSDPIRNPLTAAIFVGLLICATGLGLPSPVLGFAELLSGPPDLASSSPWEPPCRASDLRRIQEISSLAAFKLRLHPAAIWLATAQLVAVVSLFTLPALILILRSTPRLETHPHGDTIT